MESNSVFNNRMSIEEMFNAINNKEKYGIEGYNIVHKYNDWKKEKFLRDNYNLDLKVWAGKDRYPEPKFPKDENGKLIYPKKKCFIDDSIKISNSFFSKEKAEKYAELKSNLVIEKPKDNRSKLYKSERLTYISQNIKKLIFDQKLSDEQNEKIKGVKEKHPDLFKTKPHWFDKIKAKYVNKTSLSKSLKIGISSESEFLGEKQPFYNKPLNTDNDKNDPKDKKEFFPDINFTRKSNPVVKIHKPHVLNTEHLDRRNELVKDKNEKVLDKWKEKKITFSGLVHENHRVLENHRKIFYIYRSVSNFKLRNLQKQNSMKKQELKILLKNQVLNIIGNHQNMI